MGWETGALVGLKHSVAKGVLFGQLEVGGHLGGFDVPELGIGRWTMLGGGEARDLDFVRSVHFSIVIHCYEIGVGVIDVVVVCQRNGLQSDELPFRVLSGVGNIGAGQTMKETVRRTILLKDHNYVFDLVLSLRRCRGKTGTQQAGGNASHSNPPSMVSLCVEAGWSQSG